MNEKFKIIISYIIVLLVGCAFGYLLSVYSNRATADKVRGQLDNTQQIQRAAAGTSGRIKQTVESCGTGIDECLFIIREIRKNPAP